MRERYVSDVSETFDGSSFSLVDIRRLLRSFLMIVYGATLGLPPRE